MAYRWTVDHGRCPERGLSHQNVHNITRLGVEGGGERRGESKPKPKISLNQQSADQSAYRVLQSEPCKRLCRLYPSHGFYHVAGGEDVKLMSFSMHSTLWRNGGVTAYVTREAVNCTSESQSRSQSRCRSGARETRGTQQRLDLKKKKNRLFLF